MFRRSSSRKTSDRKIRSTPEKMHRAAFADETSAKVIQDPVGLR
jgi:hypothetical protein